MQSDPIDELYFDWLCSQGNRERGKGKKMPHTIVCGVMHEITFNFSVPNDDNRSAEGRELLSEFQETIRGRQVFIPATWPAFLASDATVLEVLIGMSRRCDFQVQLGPAEWFYIFLQNLGLTKYADNDIAMRDRIEIRRLVNRFNQRKYSVRGTGSIFPLKRSRHDMRTRELWYQMSDYILENHMII